MIEGLTKTAGTQKSAVQEAPPNRRPLILEENCALRTYLKMSQAQFGKRVCFCNVDLKIGERKSPSLGGFSY